MASYAHQTDKCVKFIFFLTLNRSYRHSQPNNNHYFCALKIEYEFYNIYFKNTVGNLEYISL